MIDPPWAPVLARLERAHARLCRLVLILAVGIAALTATVLVLRGTLIALLVALAVCWRRLGRWQGTSHGTARVCSIREMGQAGMLGNEDGLILGRVGGQVRPSKFAAIRALLSPSLPSDRACGIFFAAFFRSRWMGNQLIRVRDAVHLATFSRTGGGKGVSSVVPNLLSYPGSVVVIDPKCENFQKTAAFRRDLGHTIVRLDPMHLGGPGASSFNPLAFIDANAPDFLDQCRDLANMLVLRAGTEPDPYWNDATELVLTAFIAYVCACEPDPKERNLTTVRLLVSDRDKFARAVEAMREEDNQTVRRLGGQLTWFVDRELGSVLTSVQRHTAWADSEAVAACMNTNSFDPRELRRGNVSVFLVLPADRLITWAPLMRMWIGSFLRILIREGASEQHQTLFMLDEIAQLGRLQALEDAVSIARGYGIRLWFIFQSLKQVADCYGDKAGVILDNIPTMQFFALGNALDTAEMVARRIGDETIRITSPSQGVNFGSSTTPGQMGPSSSHSVNYGVQTSSIGRKLLFPDEILRLPEDTAIIFHKNMPVILARLIKYYNAPEFRSGGVRTQHGLGPLAIVQAAFALAASLVLAALAVGPFVPRFDAARQPGYVTTPWQQGQALPPWHVIQPPGVDPLARPLPSASGGAFPPRRAFTLARASGWPVVEPPGVEPSAKPFPSARSGQSPSTPASMPAGTSGWPVDQFWRVIQPQTVEQWANPLPYGGDGYSFSPGVMPAERSGWPSEQWNPDNERSILWPVNRRNRNR